MTDIATAPRVHLQHQRFRLRPWIRTRLWAQVLAGMVLGFGTGIVFGPDVARASGSSFIRLTAMVLVPLIFASIVGGLTGAKSGGELKAVGLRLAGFILVTTLAPPGSGCCSRSGRAGCEHDGGADAARSGLARDRRIPLRRTLVARVPPVRPSRTPPARCSSRFRHRTPPRSCR